MKVLGRSADTAAAPAPGPAPADANANAQSLQRERHEAGIVLPDVARKTGYSIRYLLDVENGALEVAPATRWRISGAITELLREKHRL